MFVNWLKKDVDHVMVTAAQMMKIEDEINSSGLPIEALMEKVGQLMTNWFLQRPEILLNGVVVLVGPGHNGGDGLVVARELFLAGVDVSIWCPYPLKKELTQRHFDYAQSIGIRNLRQNIFYFIFYIT